MYNKTIRFGIAFNRCVKNYGFEPEKVAAMIDAIKRAFKSNARNCEYDNQKSVDRDCRRVEKLAAEMGLTIEWPGLCPSFHLIGHGTVYFPEC